MVASSTSPLRALMLDPNSHTLPYDWALAGALAASGCQVELARSPFLYARPPGAPPPGVITTERFFTFAAGPLARRAGFERRPWSRRLVKMLEYPLDWARLLLDLRRHPPDILHVQWSLSPGLDWLLWRIAQRQGMAVVYTAHNELPHQPRPGDHRRYQRLYHTADLVLTHSERTAESLMERFNVPPARLRIAPHGPLLMDQPALSKEAARARLGLPADGPIILFAGLIERYKGLDDLIAAFVLLAREHDAAHLVVAGRPNVSLAGARAALDRADLTARTRFDARFLPDADLAAYLCAADIVALPYRATTTSGILMAARRFACPVVATTTGDLGVLIQDRVNGLLVPPRDPAALASRLGRLLANPLLASRLGVAGQRAAEREQSWEVAATRTRAAYLDAIQHHQRRWASPRPTSMV